MTKRLTIKSLQEATQEFAERESVFGEPKMYGVTDGKAVGTYLEHKFKGFLQGRYTVDIGNSAEGIDFPGLGVDVKVTSVKQPQSSCPYKSARQKIFGLGYSLLVFVYRKTDHEAARTGRLDILHAVFVDKGRTADYQMTKGLVDILRNDANAEDLIAFMRDKNLPMDDIEASQIAEEILKKPPEIGYLTISNALQWRLQYARVIDQAGVVSGITRIR